MSFYSRLGLKSKFFVFASVIVVAICIGLFFFMERIFRGYLRAELQEQADEISAALELQLSDFADLEGIQAAADRLIKESLEVSRVAFYRRTGKH